MTEQQPYDVVRAFDGFELRRYPQHAVAEVMVDGRFEDAGNRAFRYLFSYISGENEPAAKVAMTAPVIQGGGGSTIAMTAPVIQRAAAGRTVARLPAAQRSDARCGAAHAAAS
ncbi:MULTISPECIES: SOUL family heme-binding protein [Microbacterium]|uniref:SOUL family heme-binding protein n=1 Tax=Microbacterium TaxID=33882 RepID=UPI0027D44ED5|nr:MULTISPECIES: heme-binding protein [unclassified Microbacterium]